MTELEKKLCYIHAREYGENYEIYDLNLQDITREIMKFDQDQHNEQTI